METAAQRAFGGTLGRRILKKAGLGEGASPFLKVLSICVVVLSVITTLYTLYMLFLGTVSETRVRAFHVGMIGLIAFLNDPIRRQKKHGKYSIVYTAVAVALGLALFLCNLYLYIVDTELALSLGRPSTFQIVMGVIAILLVLELTRRYAGLALPIIAIVFLLYTYFGAYMPGVLQHRGYGFNRIATTMFLSKDGIYGTPTSTSSTYVVLFVIFGAALQVSGAGQTFIDTVTGLFGHMRGGPAKMAVVSSALFGTISGSSVANVVSTGSFTIPLMKSRGYSPHFAGAVEAVSSTGGQIMPPVMGAVAFLIAEFLGIHYSDVIIAAIIPALLYYLGLFLMVDFEAWRCCLPKLRKEELPDVKAILKREGQLLLPLLVLLMCLLVFQFSAARSALYSLISVLVIAMIKKETRWTIEKLIGICTDATSGMIQIMAACACAGIVIGCFGLTGLGVKFSSFLVHIANGSKFLLLLLAAIASILLGMGLPSVGVYVILSVLVAPAIIDMGVAPLPAHMFILFYGNLAAITPPVAMAAYAGAAIAGSNPMKVGWTACWIGAVAFITPFCFVYNPALLLMSDSVLDIVLCVATAILGTVFIAAGFEGFQLYSRNFKWIERGLFLATGILFMMPDRLTDLIALGTAAAGILLEVLTRSKEEVAKHKQMEEESARQDAERFAKMATHATIRYDADVAEKLGREMDLED